MKNTVTLKWILKNTKGAILPVIFLSFVSALLSLCLVGLTLVSKDVVDIATGAGSGRFFEKIGLLAFFIAAELVIQVVYTRLNIKISGKMEISFKTNIFNSLLNKELSEVYKYHTGELLNRLTADVNVIVNGFINIVPTLVALVTRLIGAFWVLFKLDSSFAMIYLVFGPLLFAVTRIYSSKMKSLHKKCQETDGKVKSYIQEALQNILVIKAFKTEAAISKEASELQKINYSYKLKRNLISIFANVLMYIAFTFGYYLALGWGAYKLSKGLITVGTLTAMLQLVSQVQTPFKGLSGIVPQYYSMLASAERLIELKNLQNDIAKESEMSYNDIYERMNKIVFSDVSFYYDERNKVIENFSYEISKGEFVAIRGISGIGKSTLLKLLLGVIEVKSGKITIELSDGKEINVDSRTRGLFAYVPQGNMILSGTIRDNIRFFNEEVSEEDIKEACRISQADSFIKDLPNGLDTVIGEKGLGLSEGQVQRIAIARAIISKAPVILLDESTSALDEQTEKDFLNCIKGLKSKTCIIVSHKQAAFDICDKIIGF